MTLEMTTLPNGLRVLTDTVDSVETVALGAYVSVGTRNEDMTENGIAHLVEHMMFKGTPRRNARDIVELIEGSGGQINAYTSREITAYYLHVLKDHVDQAVDILADMLQRSTMADEELVRERQVILQEIGMENDSPDDLIFDHYQQTAYPAQTLGAPVLGSPDVVARLPRETLQRYVTRFYTPARMVISAAGQINHADFVAQVAAHFNQMPSDTADAPLPARYVGGESRVEKDLEQAHVVLGFRGLGRTDPRYYDAVALAYILGGGMTSRLYQEIREKRGLVYSVHAFHASHADDGQFGIYAATGEGDVPAYIKAVCEQLRQLPTSLLAAEVERTRAQLKANLLMGRESMATRADQNAKYMLFHSRLLDTAELRARIEAVTVERVQTLAREIFSSTPTLAALGPISQLPTYDTVRQALAA